MKPIFFKHSIRIDLTFEETLVNSSEIRNLINKANNDRFLKNIITERNPKKVTLIYYKNKLVGFAIPRKEGKYWRTGAIFILDEYRSLGIATEFINYFFKDKEFGISYIEPTNTPSIRAFEKAGFKLNKEKIGSDNKLYLQFIKNPNQ